jgi:uncharacterized protein YjbI with pentapeptide repeats
MPETNPDSQQLPAAPNAAGWSVLDISWARRPPAALAGLAYVILAAVAFSILLSGLWIIGQFLVLTFTTAPKDFEDTSKRLLALGLLVAAPFAIWRIVISHWQARAAQAQAVAVARQADVAREEHYTTLFTTAVTQLGAMREIQDSEGTRTEPNTEARLGAIYALERIAQDSERDHWPIMETLCAYVRKNAGPPVFMSDAARDAVVGMEGGDDEELTRAREAARPYVDVQAALTVVGRRSSARRVHEDRLRKGANDRDAYCLDLTSTNLSGAVLTGNFDFAHFERSCLAFAKFRHVSVKRASFSGVRAESVQMDHAELTDSRIFSSSWEGGTFRNVKAHNLTAWSTRMDQASFYDSALTKSEFRSAEFNGANFVRTELTGVGMEHAELTGANFSGSSLETLDVSGAAIHAANLSGAQCSSVIGLTQESVDSSIGDAKTALPEGLSRPASWPSEPIGHGFQQWSRWYDLKTAAIRARRQARREKAAAMSDDDPF